MGGSNTSRRPSGPAPQVQTVDYAAMMRASSAAAKDQLREQYKLLAQYYPQMEALSLGTVDKIATNLDNEATRQAQSAVGRGLGMVRDADAEPTSIERRLYDDAERDLALGRSLSPEEIRDSQQAARAAFSARGLGTGMGASAAEVLGRDAAGRAREADRRQQAAVANNLMMGGVMGRRGQMADTLFAGAGNTLAGDPYNRALGPGLGLGLNTQGAAMNTIGGAYSNATTAAGQSAAFNANAQNWRNFNNYAMSGMGGGGNNMLMGGLGGAASGAALGASIGGPWGAGIGGGLGLGMGLLGSR